MMLKGFDSLELPSLSVIRQAKAEGYVAHGGYLKALTPAQIQMYREENFGVWLIAEGGGSIETMRTGRQGGIEDGAAARRQADALGAPNGVPIASAVDFDATLKDTPWVDAYMGGFAVGNAPRSLLVYGDGDVLISGLPPGTRAYVAGAGGWEGTSAYLAQEKPAALVQHPTATLFGMSVDPVDIYDESVVWYPAQIFPEPLPPQTALPPSLSALQQMLINAGQDLGPAGADGVWGAYTLQAISRYYSTR